MDRESFQDIRSEIRIFNSWPFDFCINKRTLIASSAKCFITPTTKALDH